MVGSERLAAQLAHLAQQAGATSASVFLPTPWNPSAPAVLVHAGHAAPLPELASVDAAEAFAAEVLESGAWNGATITTEGFVTSKSGTGVLIAAPLLTSLWAAAGGSSAPAGGLVRRRSADQRRMAPAAGWIALRLPPASVAAAGAPAAVALAHALAATIVSVYSVLTDPLTGLPGRHELMGVLRADLDRARRRRLPCALLLVNPLGLDTVNEQFGRRSGDGLIREVVQTMQGLLRRSDVLMRYGGAIFALPLGHVGADAAMLVAERIRQHLTGRAFLQESVHLKCAVGVVACDAADAEGLEPLDLLKRVNDALGLARQRQGDDVVLWQPEASDAGPSTDRLLGIFTGRTDKDYRNMGLLWDVLQAVSSAAGSTDLAAKVVERLFAVLHPTRAALFVSGDAGERLLFGQQRLDDLGEPRALGAGDLSEDERAVVSAAVDAGAVRQRSTQLTTADGERRPQVAVAVPLITDGRTLGAVALVGSPEVLDLDRTDIHVLSGVAGQLAVALDREHLAERHRVHSEHERRRLQAEVLGLRSQQSPIVFQSAAMAEVMTRARRVAATETTVLITGESGTGKEMMAQTLHQLSGRRARPFVIVDCGAIPATLIDSELFGHERGAFTGAQQRSIGRLAMADGGTVFLDEIGELPLDVQSRLLRFVQEKTISMVGGTKSRKVDVRIVAATNRRLEDEVRAGRFREDLFYRLNVVRLHIPPLRERPEDVRLLADHFARAAAAEQRRSLAGFTPAAERALSACRWPGNIRELQNTILQAVVLSDGEWLDAADLKLADLGPLPAAPAAAPVAPSWPAAAPFPAPSPSASPAPAGGSVAFEVAWDGLRRALDEEVRRAATATPRQTLPLGRWLGHEVVLVAHEHAAGIGARAATRIGLPQTTFARRLRHAETDRQLSTRPPTWGAVRAALLAVVAADDVAADGLADRAESLLLDVVLTHAPTPLAYAAALMGLSPPTMKQRLTTRVP